MSKKMNWRVATLSSKRQLSVIDEVEYRGNDAAARWLERQAKSPLKSKKTNLPKPPKTDGSAI